jgi:acyl-CoA thioester hydrolase
LRHEWWAHLTPHNGILSGHIHTLPLRVYYEDTDFSGVVYHASYLRFMERGRTELIRALGIEQGVLFEEGAAFMVRSMSIEFIKPARVDEVILVETTPLEAKGATLMIAQKISRGSEVLITANVKVAYVVKGRAARIPESLRRL